MANNPLKHIPIKEMKTFDIFLLFLHCEAKSMCKELKESLSFGFSMQVRKHVMPIREIIHKPQCLFWSFRMASKSNSKHLIRCRSSRYHLPIAPLLEKTNSRGLKNNQEIDKSP